MCECFIHFIKLARYLLAFVPASSSSSTAAAATTITFIAFCKFVIYVFSSG